MMKEDIQSLNYSSLRRLRSAFRRSGGRSYTDSKGFSFPNNMSDTDTPGWNYFKILFDFDSPFLSLDHNAPNELNPPDIESSNGILTVDGGGANGKPSKVSRGNIKAGELNPNITIKNTAYNYLMLNGEYERAELLKQFVQLLSNINTQSPWYFQTIEGLDEALQRHEYQSNEFKPVEDENKKISIKCLPDAIDSRIGTLMDLYRSICFSHSTRRVIVPANLRKFDIIIYVFNTKIGYSKRIYDESSNKYKWINSGLHNGANLEQNNMQRSFDGINSLNDASVYTSSSKMFSIHNCEIDIDSGTTPWNELNNAEGWANEYTISLFYDMVYEQRYNEFLQRFIGDAIAWDLNYSLTVENERESYGDGTVPDTYHTDHIQSELSSRLKEYDESASQYKKAWDDYYNALLKWDPTNPTTGHMPEPPTDPKSKTMEPHNNIQNSNNNWDPKAKKLVWGNIFYMDFMNTDDAISRLGGKLINKATEFAYNKGREVLVKGSTQLSKKLTGTGNIKEKIIRRENRKGTQVGKNLNPQPAKPRGGNSRDEIISRQSTGGTQIGRNLFDQNSNHR